MVAALKADGKRRGGNSNGEISVPTGVVAIGSSKSFKVAIKSEEAIASIGFPTQIPAGIPDFIPSDTASVEGVLLPPHHQVDWLIFKFCYENC